MSEAQQFLILIVEDEAELAEIYRGFFQRDGFRVVLAADGIAASELHRKISPDLVVLDVRLPRRDGIEVLAEIRRSGNTPVILSTALGEDFQKLAALAVGADDYLVKPFNPLELVARAKAVLRRSCGGEQSERLLRIGILEIDPMAYEARIVRDVAPPQPLDLTITEFRILSRLARSPRRVFTRAEILEECLPTDRDALDRTVDSHISNLRTKLKATGMRGALPAVRGVGYRLGLT